MDKLNGGRHVVNGGLGKNSMAKIEDVAGPLPCSLQNIVDTAFKFRKRPKQRHGVQVSLDGDVVPNPRPRFIKFNVPIQSQDVAAGTAHERQER